MFYKLKSSVPQPRTRKIILWTLDISLIVFICCAYLVLRGRQSGVSNERFIVFDEGYEVQCSLPPEELMWRVERSLVEADGSVRNVAEFPGDAQAPTLVVLAGRRPARLQRLLAALAQVRGISSALLIVSHSFYDETVNELVRRVDYCRVLQIFYPYSLQLFPGGFPGPGAGRSRRYATAAERKQHWWWTAHFLFDHYVHIDPKFSGFALFLREDDYVAPDALYMLRYARRAFEYHPEAEVISLGGPVTGDSDYGLLTLSPWQPPFQRGLAFNRTVWRKVLEADSQFCMYDDASWGYSLLNAFASLPRGYVDMIASAVPRVVPGRARGGGRAGAAAAAFPARVRTAFAAAPGGRVARAESAPRGVGGWSDPRDQLLCLDPFLMTTRVQHNGSTPSLHLRPPGT